MALETEVVSEYSEEEIIHVVNLILNIIDFAKFKRENILYIFYKLIFIIICIKIISFSIDKFAYSNLSRKVAVFRYPNIIRFKQLKGFRELVL